MFEIKLKTIYKDDREVETVASAEHFVDFEEHFDQPVGDSLRTGRFTYVYYLSWLTSSSGIEFKEWVKTVRDAGLIQEEEVPPFGPTTSDTKLPC